MFSGWHKRRERRIEELSNKLIGSQQNESASLNISGKPLTSANIGFLIVLVNGSTANEISELVKEIVDISLSHDADLHVMTSNLIIAFVKSGQNQIESLEKISQHIVGKLTTKSKVVWCVEAGAVGVIGNEDRCSWSFVAPSFNQALKIIVDLDWGVARRIS